MDLENTVQALNDQLIQQYRDFQRVTQEISRLEAKIDASQSPDSTQGGHEVPPHY